MAFAVIGLQIRDHFFINGIDAYFHMSDAYETARQIATGHYSYFLSLFSFNRSARIVNALYGPAWGYFSGLLLLVVKSWINWEIVIALITLIVSGISMYQLARYWQVTPLVRILISFLYMLSFDVMTMINGQQYDGLGAAFLPWVLLIGSEIIKEGDFHPWQLVLITWFLAESHLMTLMLGTLALFLGVIFALMVHRHSIVKLIKKLAGSVIVTLLLTFNVWGSIFEIVGSNHRQLVPTYSFTDITAVQWDSVQIRQLFKYPSNNLTLLGLSTTVLFILIFLLYIINFRQLSAPLHFMMWAWGIIFFWLSTVWFPWEHVQRYSEYFHTVLQFPKRFLPVSIIAFYLIFGILISKFRLNGIFHRVPVIYGALILILTLFIIHNVRNDYNQALIERQSYFSNQVTNVQSLTRTNHPRPQQVRDSLSDGRPGAYFHWFIKGTPDYMPTQQVIRTDAQYHHLVAYWQNTQQIIFNRIPRTYHIDNHAREQLDFNVKSRRPVTLPIVDYAHTQLTLNGKRLVDPRTNSVKTVIVRPKPGRNSLQVRYQPSLWYEWGVVISIISWIGFIWLWLKKRIG